MKSFLPFIFLLLLPFFSFTGNENTTLRLNGYFIVQCFAPKYKCGCGLNIPHTACIQADSLSKCNCLCDGNYYKDFSLISYVSPEDLDPAQLDDFNYQIALQPREKQMYLSTNKMILGDNYQSDTSYIHNPSLIKMVEGDTLVAERTEALVRSAQLDYKRKIAWRILLKGEVSVLRLKNAPDTLDYKTSRAKEQYLFLNSSDNRLEFVKVIQDPF